MPRRARPAPADPTPVPADPFALEGHLFFWLTQVLGSRDRQVAQALRPFGLRVPEWRTLACLRARRDSTLNELADLTTIDRSTLSRTVDRMAADDLVQRVGDTRDLRVTRLTLSPRGAALFERVLPVVDELNRQAVAGLPDGMTDVMRWALQQMRANLEPADARRDRRAA